MTRIKLVVSQLLFSFLFPPLVIFATTFASFHLQQDYFYQLLICFALYFAINMYLAILVMRVYGIIYFLATLPPIFFSAWINTSMQGTIENSAYVTALEIIRPAAAANEQISIVSQKDIINFHKIVLRIPNNSRDREVLLDDFLRNSLDPYTGCTLERSHLRGSYYLIVASC